MSNITILAAVDSEFGIGKDGGIPWDEPEDRRLFRRMTLNKPVIMSRVTYESICQFRKTPLGQNPLPDRQIVVISSTLNPDSVSVFPTILGALKYFESEPEVIIAGGQGIYEEVMDRNLYTRIILTHINGNLNCDRFFPKFEMTHHHISIFSQKDLKVNCIEYANRNYNMELEEVRYRQLLQNIIRFGERKQTRNGFTSSLFSQKLRFDLSEGKLPAINSRRVWLKGCFEELIWILNGSLTAKDLAAKGIHIWDGNTSTDFLHNKPGTQHFEEGEMGETYGFLMRHFGAQYQGLNHDYSGKGFDQLQHVITQIRDNPADRRIIMCLFKPDAQTNCSLPPCMMMYHFNVNIQSNRLNCQIYIRSSDVPIGLPWNILTASFMVHLVSKLTGRNPGILEMLMVDAHIYETHLESVQELLQRNINAKEFPKLTINTPLNSLEDLLALNYSNITVTGYEPLAKLEMKMIA